MWRDISLFNRGQMVELIDEFQSQLTAVRQLIDSGDGEPLEAVYLSANRNRTKLAGVNS